MLSASTVRISSLSPIFVLPLIVAPLPITKISFPFSILIFPLTILPLCNVKVSSLSLPVTVSLIPSAPPFTIVPVKVSIPPAVSNFTAVS